VRAGLLGGALALLFAAAASSYVRTRTTDGTHCLHWPAGPLVFTQNKEGDALLGDAGFDAVTRAWQTWAAQMQACGDLAISEGPHSSSRSTGTPMGGDGENLVLFRPVLCSDVADAGDECEASGSCGNVHDCWDHTSGVLALTTVTFRTADGVIVDADVEFNAAQAFFTAVDSPPCDPFSETLDCVANDTQETATHEFGHALGLDESPDPNSTMYGFAAVGETSKRVLDPSSEQFVCDVYPRGRPSQDCLLPDGGPADVGGCSTAGTVAFPLPAFGLLGLLWLGTRRRKR
jgi:MYXO-CTERM domain-containing protein